jgi:hypothetical protein
MNDRPVSDWLNVMLAEIARKKAEEKAALEEAGRRKSERPGQPTESRRSTSR